MNGWVWSRRPLQGRIAGALLLDAGITRFDDGGDAAAGTEVADDLGPDGIGGFDDVVEASYPRIEK